MSDAKIESRIGVQAPPLVIWDLLKDIESWPSWNPIYPKASGRLGYGETLHLTCQLPKQDQPIDPRRPLRRGVDRDVSSQARSEERDRTRRAVDERLDLPEHPRDRQRGEIGQVEIRDHDLLAARPKPLAEIGGLAGMARRREAVKIDDQKRV